MPKFPHLFQPISIGELEFPNRIMIPAMALGYSLDQLRAFHLERMRSQPGALVLGPSGVDPRFPGQLNLYHENQIPRISKLVSELRSKSPSTKLLLQIYHPGRYGLGPELVSASDIPAPIFTRSKPRPLTKPEIQEIQDKFSQVAQNAAQAGFDGVELLAATGYLISQFLSPSTNKRSDEYGGSLQNRLRFLLEIIQKIRSRLGKFCLGVRISGDEFVPGGNRLPQQKEIAQALERAGVDYLSVNAGWHESRIPLITMSVPPGGFAYLARAIKSVVKIPVAASHRINTPELAERLISQGYADLVAIARGLIADPEFISKSRDGRSHLIRPCIACNQGCLDSIMRFKPVGCMVNPMAGRESLVEIKPSSPKRIVVVGAGPAGIQFSLTASQRKHELILFEKNRIGGQLRLATKIPGRWDFSRLIHYWERQLRELDLELRFQEPDIDSILELDPEAVVIATGSQPKLPEIPGIHGDNVATAHQILEGRDVGDSALILGGGSLGCETGIYLACLGKMVTILSSRSELAKDMGPSTRWTRLQLIRRLGIQIKLNSRVVRIDQDGLEIMTPKGSEFLECDTVVVALRKQPDPRARDLADALRSSVPEIHLIGDCSQVGDCYRAIHSGFELGIKI